MICIPRGFMCIACTNIYNNCSHLDFASFKRISKPDEDGYVEVKCTSFMKTKDGAKKKIMSMRYF
jgi:hypothetical protein